jgi:hypothetical protein
MSGKGMSRREFLQSSGLAVVGVAVAGAGVTIFDPTGAWAVSTEVLDQHTATTLLDMARQLYPHDMLGDQYYAKVVVALDEQAKGDSGVADMIAQGVAGLDSAMGVNFVDLSEGNQTQVLKDIEGSDFFAAVQGATVNGIYRNPLVYYRYFGFEGSSVEHGGYLHRGFDDIRWLPES